MGEGGEVFEVVCAVVGDEFGEEVRVGEEAGGEDK